MLVFEHLELTDGTTANTRYLHDHVSYGVMSYAPAVAQRRRSALGGNGPYDEVIDTMVVNVYGDSAQNAIDNLEWLNRILDQAGRWWAGEHDLSSATVDRIAPVKIRARVQDSPLTQPVQSLVLGARETPNITLAPTFDIALGRWVFRDVEVSFLRLGIWLNNSSTSATSATAANPTVSSVTITADDYSPRKMQWVTDANHPASTLYSGFMLFAQVGRLVLTNAEDKVAAPAGYTSVADAANRAVNGNVLRYTPVGTTYADSSSGNLGGMTSRAYRVAVYATIRNNSASATWQVRVGMQGTDGTDLTAFLLTAPVTIDAASLEPRVFYLGQISQPLPIANAYLSVAVSSIAGGPTLDIDSIVFQSLDNEQSYAVGFSVEDTAAGGTTLTDLIIDHRILTNPDPLFSVRGLSYFESQSYSGDIAIHQYHAVDALLFAVQENYWRLVNVSGAVSANVTLTATQYAAYLTPQ